MIGVIILHISVITGFYADITKIFLQHMSTHRQLSFIHKVYCLQQSPEQSHLSVDVVFKLALVIQQALPSPRLQICSDSFSWGNPFFLGLLSTKCWLNLCHNTKNKTQLKMNEMQLFGCRSLVMMM